jgi:hypothetical protein
MDTARTVVLEHIAEGGFAPAVCRIVLAGMASIGSFERRSFRLARLLAELPVQARAGASQQTDWVRLLKEQARVAAVAPVEALNALELMLPNSASRESALAVAAAVMMIEPTLVNPRSEIIEFLIDTLGVNPQRVMALALKLTHSLQARWKNLSSSPRGKGQLNFCRCVKSRTNSDIARPPSMHVRAFPGKRSFPSNAGTQTPL